VPLIARRQRARTNQAHLAARHIEQLRQFVQKRAPQKTAHSGHARIALQFEQLSLFPQFALQPRVQPFGLPYHRAELEERKQAPLTPVPFLPKQNRRPIEHKNQYNYRHKNRRQGHHESNRQSTFQIRAPRPGRRRLAENKMPLRLVTRLRTATRTARQHRQTRGGYGSLSPRPQNTINEREDFPHIRVSRIFEEVCHPFIWVLSAFLCPSSRMENTPLHPPALQPTIGVMLTPEFHAYFMRLAIREAAKAAEAEEVPAGCVIIQEPQSPSLPLAAVKVLARAHNQTELLNDSTAHAEMIALTQASSALGDWRLTGTILYVTKEPCPMCAGAIVLARIPLVVWGVSDPKRGGHSVFSILNHPNLNHRPEILTGVLEPECRTMLQEFFRARREEN